MKPLFVGGTFDPIHVGHIITARAAAESIGCDHVVLVPCAMANHKESKTGFKHRFEMATKAVAGDSFFSVSDIEHELTLATGNSYTSTVAVKLRQLYSISEKVTWMIGSDSISKAIRWKNQDLLKTYVLFAIAARPGYDCDIELLSTRNFSFVKADSPLIDISSTDIRKRVAEGKNIRYLVPDPVGDYIYCNGLYVNRGSCEG